MSNDDILCEAPGPDGTTCTLPYGHPGNVHAFEIQLPPMVAHMIEQHISQMEAETKRLKQARFMYYAGTLGFMALWIIVQAFINWI